VCQRDAVPPLCRRRLLGNFAGSWRFEEAGPGQTRVSFHYHLLARPWWLSWLVTPIMGWWFARDTRKRLAALKTAVEHQKLLVARTDSQQTW
jgi:hypothetical protein